MNLKKFSPYPNRPVCEYIYNAKELLKVIQNYIPGDCDTSEDVVDELYLPCSYLEDNLDKIQECVNNMESRLFKYREAIEDLGFVRMDGK